MTCILCTGSEYFEVSPINALLISVKVGVCKEISGKPHTSKGFSKGRATKTF